MDRVKVVQLESYSDDKMDALTVDQKGGHLVGELGEPLANIWAAL